MMKFWTTAVCKYVTKVINMFCLSEFAFHRADIRKTLSLTKEASTLLYQQKSRNEHITYIWPAATNIFALYKLGKDPRYLVHEFRATSLQK